MIQYNKILKAIKTMHYVILNHYHIIYVNFENVISVLMKKTFEAGNLKKKS